MQECRKGNSRPIPFDCKLGAGHRGGCSPFTLPPRPRGGTGGGLTYTVEAGAMKYTTDEAGARAVLTHAERCQGCGEKSAFHRSDIYGTSGLVPAEVFPVNLPTGAVLYPGSNARLPVAERVAAVLAVLRRVEDRGTRLMREAVAARVARLEAYRPE
ncbi:hypothetical protein ACFV42_23015 [Streptomyces solisilvae]|uniref:hypothetical protein n=1 Tax=Streptomyces malaysiensis TaxID=92644 RepID=UPI00368B0EB9